MTRPKPGAPSAQLTAVELADARTWMQAARVWTIERLPYLDTALTSMLLVESPGLGTVAVDARWRLYYDPQRTLRVAADHGIAALAGDWVHEVMHLLRDHPVRWQELREPAVRHPIFNLAGDAFVNADVADLGMPLLPTDVTFAMLGSLVECDRSMTTEEVYRLLVEAGSAVGGAGSGAADCGSGSGGDRRPWEQPLSDDVDDGSVDASTAEVIREESARKIRERSTDDHVPHALRTWAAQYLEPSVDWRRELRSVVSRRIGQLAGVTDYTFTRLARRRVPGYVLPGMAGPEPPRLAAVIDTSGSMSPEELGQALGDLLGLMRTASGRAAAIPVFAVDNRVASQSVVRRPSDVAGLELRGGGGTDMGVGLAACARLQPVPGIVVVLTDGYTPWPASAPPGLEAASVIAVVSQAETVGHVPSWIRVISVG